MEKRVLVIDADLRKPVQHKLFGVETEVGLSDVLARNVPWSQAVITRDAVKNLDLIPSGKLPPNPAELLGGEAMRALLAQVQQHYDLVLLDSPPTLIVADACVLASLVQGVFLVVRAGVTTPEAIARVQSVLSTVNAKLLGTILNAIPSSNGIGPYGMGYYHSNYYHSQDQSDKSGRLKQATQHILSEAQKLFNRYL
jgi:capsular exopolysaccharide synthesis family protein